MFRDSIPVVMYHHVSPAGRELNVTPEVFEDQLAALRRKGWRTLSGDEFMQALSGDRPPGKSVLLTFDDGFADNYVYAYPLLKKYGMKAMIFVATALLGESAMDRRGFVPLPHRESWTLLDTERRPEVMCTWQEVQEMDASGVIDIQSHGATHRIPAFRKEGKYDAIREDLTVSRAELERRLSKKVLHLCWPKGSYDAETIALAKQAGYQVLYTVQRGANTGPDLDRINRLPVKCRGGDWLAGRLTVYASGLLTRFYLAVRKG